LDNLLFFLSHYIAELSRKRWTTWIQSDDSDISLSDKQKEALEKSLIATLPGIGPIINVITALGDK